jgi:predicted homoserine dehydrogenase-like protein
MLDGEGGYTVWGKLAPAETSVQMNGLPIGLAHRVRLSRDVEKGALLSAADVVLDENSEAARARRAMIERFRPT